MAKKFLFELNLCMKISSAYNQPYYIQSRNNTQKKYLNPANFCGKDIFINPLRFQPLKSLNKFKNFTISEYLKLSPKELQSLNLEYSKCDNICEYRLFESTHDVAASCIKAVLDKSFGQGNYEVLPIGRSLSSIAKVLGYKIGENNVKNIPMSNASRFMNVDELREAYKNGKIDMFAEYLNSIGLSKEEILSSGKTYILTDYCLSGNSLRGAKNLFDYVFDSKTSNYILPVDIYKIFQAVNVNSPNYQDFLFTIDKHLYQTKYKYLSTVNHCGDLSKTAEAVKDLSQGRDDVKLFRFKLLDNEMVNSECAPMEVSNVITNSKGFFDIGGIKRFILKLLGV